MCSSAFFPKTITIIQVDDPLISLSCNLCIKQTMSFSIIIANLVLVDEVCSSGFAIIPFSD